MSALYVDVCPHPMCPSDEITLTKQIQETRLELNLLRSEAQSIERYAREKYLMKKDNEEIFIVKTP
jgi:cell division protein FtsB